VSSQPLRFLPERLSEEINRRVLTNAEAAQLIGVTEKTVWRWRQGSGSMPRRAHVRRMAEVFECDRLSFFADHETPEDVAA
jgi:transcriptional regulator with XRE-family HTH domain